MNTCGFMVRAPQQSFTISILGSVSVAMVGVCCGACVALLTVACCFSQRLFVFFAVLALAATALAESSRERAPKGRAASALEARRDRCWDQFESKQKLYTDGVVLVTKAVSESLHKALEMQSTQAWDLGVRSAAFSSWRLTV